MEWKEKGGLTERPEEHQAARRAGVPAAACPMGPDSRSRWGSGQCVVAFRAQGSAKHCPGLKSLRSSWGGGT